MPKQIPACDLKKVPDHPDDYYICLTALNLLLFLFLVRKHEGDSYSVLNAFTGFATAAFMVFKPTTANAKMNIAIPTTIKTHISI